MQGQKICGRVLLRRFAEQLVDETDVNEGTWSGQLLESIPRDLDRLIRYTERFRGKFSVTPYPEVQYAFEDNREMFGHWVVFGFGLQLAKEPLMVSQDAFFSLRCTLLESWMVSLACLLVYVFNCAKYRLNSDLSL